MLRRSIHTRGVTLIELLIVVAILATLLSLATVGYRSYRYTAEIEACKRDIIEIAAGIERYQLANQAWPSGLGDVNMAGKLDPWGNAYLYARIPSLIGNIVTGGTNIRQDANQRPINTFYDLYSKGADGDTVSNISAAQSKDDVIRARDGDFIGLAKDY